VMQRSTYSRQPHPAQTSPLEEQRELAVKQQCWNACFALVDGIAVASIRTGYSDT
jgi:hypothetical protein